MRKDLSAEQQAVQAGHAVAEWLLNHFDNKPDWNNGTLVYLSVDDEDDLCYWMEQMKKQNILFVPFQEPDIDKQFTAVTSVGDGRIFRKLKLMKF